ncbi:MAG: hypothetical protein N2255_06335, partial [Kiritimatiellae bacterium]|nr:hypothetical protein [Kiritimatiellia bacterium]
MKRTGSHHYLATVVVLGFLSTATGAELQAGTSMPEQLVLDEGSWWRCFLMWKTPYVIRESGTREPAKSSGDELDFVVETPPPPADWMQSDFPDSSWSRFRLPRTRRPELDYGFWRFGSHGPSLALQCLRAKFTVPDPAAVKSLVLSIAYRGGLVVYLNGKEVARAHLPTSGTLAPDALAEDYPRETFTHEGMERGSNCILAEFGHPTRFKDQLEKRIRRLDRLVLPV